MNSIYLINAVGFVVIIIYAIAFSKMLIAPITALSRRLANMNEHLIRPIKVEQIPMNLRRWEKPSIVSSEGSKLRQIPKRTLYRCGSRTENPLGRYQAQKSGHPSEKRTPEEYIEAIESPTKA